MDSGVFETWRSSVSGGISPYSYEWTTSSNGVNYGGVVSTQNYYSQVMPNQNLYLKLKVTSSDSQVKYAYLYVQPTSSCSLCRSGNTNEEFDEEYFDEEYNSGFSISPMPITTTGTISYQVDRYSFVRIELLATLGRTIPLVSGFHNAGTYNKIFDTFGLTSGMYPIRIQTNGTEFVRKIMIIN